MKTPREILEELCHNTMGNPPYRIDQALSALRELVLSYQLKYGQLDMKLEREKVVYNRALEDIANLFGGEE